MDRRIGMAMLLALAAGCTPVADPSQYKPYNQLAADSTKIDAAVGDGDTEPAIEPTFAAESSDADVQPPASGSDLVTTVATSSLPDAAPPAAPTMKVVNGKVVVQTLPGGVRVLVPEHDFKVEGPQGALRVNYDDIDLLRVLNMDPVTPDAVDHFPAWLKHLSGKRVRIRGFMLPTFEAKGLEQFVLARDTGACCFGPQAKLYYLIMVQMHPGHTSDYIANRAFDVVGTFRIEMYADQGKALGLYWIDDAQIVER